MEIQGVERGLGEVEGSGLPSIVERAGEGARRSFVEFFVANIRNVNTRKAYERAVGAFLDWCEARGLELETIDPIAVSAYVETHPGARLP